MTTVLLVSSTEAEFSGLTRRFASRRLPWPVDYAAEMEHDGARWILVANGAGIDLACQAFQVARENAPVDAVVSTGYCGALDPAIQPAEVVIATEVYPSSVAARPVSGRDARRGMVAGADHVVGTAREKGELRRATGAATVDMESHGLARAAADAGIPFYCVRAVTDVAGEDMHLDFNGARDAAGRIRASKLVWDSLRKPVTALPELFRLAFRARRASNNLGEFLAACRF
jgi:adenosylhomocysteine nucleosidase